MVSSKESFVVQILSTQNATWQGVVSCPSSNIVKSFRSALELIKLMDSALFIQEDSKITYEDGCSRKL